MGEERALIAAGQENVAKRLAQELAARSISTRCVFSAQEAREALSEGVFTILLIFFPLPGDGAQLALDAAGHSDCAILLVAREEAKEEEAVQRACEAGSLFLTRPLNRERLVFALESAACIHRRIAYLKKENALLQRKMRELRSVERAKYLLMQTLGMTEAQAHRFIEKQAMDARQTRAEVALRILKTYENT